MASTQAGPALSVPRPLEAHVERWASQVTALERRSGRRALPGWVLLGLGGTLLCLTLNVLRPYARIAVPGAAAGVAGAVLWILLAGKLRRRAAVHLATQIRETCLREGLAPAEAVRLLSEKCRGGVARQVLAGVDPGALALAQVRQEGEEAFRLLSLRPVPRLEFTVVRGTGRNIAAVILRGEHRADEFARIAANALENGLHEEAVAALAMVDMLYHEIAPRVPERILQAGQDDPTRTETAGAIQLLFSGFDLLPEMAAVLGAHLPARASGEDEMAQGAPVEAAPKPFIGRCVEYIGTRTQEAYKRDRAWKLLASIPDRRTLPYLLAALEQRSFFPEAIAGLGRLGEEGQSRLLESVQAGRGRLRFHATMALGMLQVGTARPLLQTLLPSVHSSVERAGFHYALARLGEEGHAPELQPLLGQNDAGTRQAAAIALAHLDEPVDETLLLRHLEDDSAAVRLYLVKKTASQGAGSDRLVEALVARLEDGEEEVREAAVDALQRMAPQAGQLRLVELARSGPPEARMAACRVLAEAPGGRAVPFLEAALKEAATNAERRRLLLALGNAGSAEAARIAGAFLDDADLSGAAFAALQRIAAQEPQAARRAIESRLGSRVRLLVLDALGGDAQAAAQLAGMLKPRTDFLTLLDLLEVVPQLRSPAFVAPLHNLLSYRNPPRFPGDRSVSYLALKALVHSELAGA